MYMQICVHVTSTQILCVRGGVGVLIWVCFDAVCAHICICNFGWRLCIEVCRGVFVCQIYYLKGTNV